jgi:two-component system, OmpR family, sensor histidine kinase ArlS
MSCRVRISFMDGAVCIEFRDRGIGIEPQEQKNIFEPFYRGRNTSEVKGHGIGLSLVKNIIQVHNGTITLESEPGKGSVFTLNLPQPKLQGPERFVPEFSQY